jgi:hypothetical protein
MLGPERDFAGVQFIIGNAESDRSHSVFFACPFAECGQSRLFYPLSIDMPFI